MKKLVTAIALQLLFLALGLASSAQAQDILPKQFGKWVSGPGPAGEPRLVFPDTPVSNEARRKHLELERYSSGNKWLRVVLEEYPDPSSAYEVYTSKLTVGMNPSTVAALTATGDDQLLALVGNRVVQVWWIKNASDADLRLLLASVKQNANSTPLPPIRVYLPEERLVQGSQRYALGPEGFNAALESVNEGKYSVVTPEIGFNSGAEAILASYSVGRDKWEHLLIIEYPTPQLAEQHLRHLQPVLRANSGLANTTVERKASLLSLVLSPTSPESAAMLRAQINFETQVTWNEPSQTLTDPPWLVVVKDIFVGTLAFCGTAIVLGVAFGGVRVLTKRFFPGKVFDRPEDMEVLQLGLSGKRIDPRDFY
jgi:hypothetical protein